MITLLSAHQQKKERTELILKNIYNLPPIPKVMNEALKLLEIKTTSTSELSRVISRDQGLILKILTISNSPMYGLQRRVTSIDFALLILGFSELRNIITVLSLSEAFKNKTDKYLDNKEFWMHSLLTGCAAKRLAEDLEYYNSGEAFIAGFLHDMGISVIHKYFHSSFVQIQELIVNKNLPQLEAETEVLGMNHQEIGNYLMTRWNFPLDLCDAILNHHNPSLAKQDDKMLSAIIHFADFMTLKLQMGNIYYDKDFSLDRESIAAMQFKNDEEMDRFIEGYKELFNNQIESVRHLN
jgi:HD-like signal output (HDOD) protein